jgi:hypothetical protein
MLMVEYLVVAGENAPLARARRSPVEYVNVGVTLSHATPSAMAFH